MTILAYLDQTHLGRMSEEHFTVLSALVEADAVALPISDVHLIETIKQASRYRQETLRRIAGLRRDLVLTPEVTVLGLEWLAFHGQGRVRDALVGCSPGSGVLWDGATADALPLAAEVLDDDAGSALAANADESFGAAAGNLAALRAVTIDHVREQLVAGLRMLQISPEPRLDDVPATEEGLASAFPSVGLRRAFYAHATTLEPNDIADLSFVCRTVPHFDVVAVDRSMHDRLHRTRTSIPPELARHLFKARVVRNVAQAIEVIHELARERA